MIIFYFIFSFTMFFIYSAILLVSFSRKKPVKKKNITICIIMLIATIYFAIVGWDKVALFFTVAGGDELWKELWEELRISFASLF